MSDFIFNWVKHVQQLQASHKDFVVRACGGLPCEEWRANDDVPFAASRVHRPSPLPTHLPCQAREHQTKR